MRGRARGVLSSVGWMAGGGAVVAAAQIPYAAVTARVLGPADFGAYAGALVVVTGLALVANAGLNEAVATWGDVDAGRLRSLASYALGLGVLFGLVGWGTAPLWAALFGTPELADVLRPLTVSVLMAPPLALATGLARQRRRFRPYALVTTAAALCGLAVGFALVLSTRSPVALAAPGVVTPLLSFAGHRLYTDRWLVPGRLGRGLVRDARFGGSATAINVTEYLGTAGLQATVARGLGGSALGQWNRASVLGQMPVQMVALPVSRVLYPELGETWDRGARTRQFDAACHLLTWAAVVLAATWGVLLSGITPLLLGPGWERAAALALPLALGAGLVLASTPMTSALMAGGEHRRLFAIQAAATLLLIGAGVVGAALGSVWVAATAVPVAAALRHLAADRACRASGFASVGAARSLAGALAAGAVAVLLVRALGALLADLGPGLVAAVQVAVATVGLAVAAHVWLRADRTRAALAELGIRG